MKNTLHILLSLFIIQIFSTFILKFLLLHNIAKNCQINILNKWTEHRNILKHAYSVHSDGGVSLEAGNDNDDHNSNKNN